MIWTPIHISGLDDRYLAAITSAFFKDMTYSQIAIRDSVPLGTLKSWIRRGMATARANMELENQSTIIDVSASGPDFVS